MIKVQNQIAVQFNIGGFTDFINAEDFKGFRVVELAGGLRPYIELSFDLKNPAIIPFLNSGNIITMMFGIDTPESEVMQFEICGDTKTKEFQVGSTVHLMGAMYNRKFTSQIKSDEWIGKSYEVLGYLTAVDGLKFHSNVSKTNDKQTWYQSGKTDWGMSKYIAQRAYRDSETFFVYGFDNNNFYFFDMRELLKRGPKWILTVRGGGDENPENPIVNIGTYFPDDTNAGTNADLAGKNTTIVSYNLDTGEFTNPRYSLKTMTTMQTNKVNINSTGCINYDYHITTGDEHPYSVEAQNQNFRNSVLYSSYTVHVPVTGQYRNFRLFDVVQLNPSDSDKEAEGIYFITGIAREYRDLQYSVMLTLNRESANGIKGDLEGGS